MIRKNQGRDVMSFSQEVQKELSSDSNLEMPLNEKRIYVRDAFLYGGIISTPDKTYHLEFTVHDDEKATKLTKILKNFNLHPKKIARGGQFVVYIKEADEIADVLNIMGAHKSLLSLERTRVEKSIRNEINRKVNCETANLNKTIHAAQAQIDAIKIIKQHKGLSYLSPQLEEVALLRLKHESASLSEIGAMLQPPVSKSGINHRMRNICSIAHELESIQNIQGAEK